MKLKTLLLSAVFVGLSLANSIYQGATFIYPDKATADADIANVALVSVAHVKGDGRYLLNVDGGGTRLWVKESIGLLNDYADATAVQSANLAVGTAYLITGDKKIHYQR